MDQPITKTTQVIKKHYVKNISLSNNNIKRFPLEKTLTIISGVDFTKSQDQSFMDQAQEILKRMASLKLGLVICPNLRWICKTIALTPYKSTRRSTLYWDPPPYPQWSVLFWTIGKQTCHCGQNKGNLSEKYLEKYLSYQHQTWFVDWSFSWIGIPKKPNCFWTLGQTFRSL